MQDVAVGFKVLERQVFQLRKEYLKMATGGKKKTLVC